MFSMKRKLTRTAAFVVCGLVAGTVALSQPGGAQQPPGAQAKQGPRKAPQPPKVTPGPVIDCTTLVPTKRGVDGVYGLQVQLARFSADGKAVFLQTDWNGRVWDTASGKPISPPLRPSFVPQAAAFRGEGAALLVAGYGCMQVYDPVTGKPFYDLADTKRVFPPLQRSQAGDCFGRISAAAFSPDGSLLMVGDQHSRTARVFNAAKGFEVSRCDYPSGDVRRVAFGAVGGRLVGACAGLGDDAKGAFRLWWVGNGDPIATVELDNEVYALAFSPDGRRLLTVSGRIKTGGKRDEGAIRAWDSATGKQVGGTWENVYDLEQLAFRPDGKEVLAVVRGKAVTWDAATGKRRHVHAHPDPGRVKAAAWSPDGKRVFTVGETYAAGKRPNGSLRIWDAATGRLLRDPVEHPQPVWCVAVAPDGRTVVTGCCDGKARLWNVE